MPSLTREQLPAMIAAAGRESEVGSLYGAHEDGYVIDHRGPHWVVFISERGAEYDLREHATEDQACVDLLDRLRIGGA